MIIRSIEIEKFRSFDNASFALGKRLTAIAGRNATQKSTVLGMIGQPFTISSKDHPMYGCKTIDGYNFRSQFKEKFKISPVHDVIGEHKWKLLFHNGVYDHSYYSVESIPRNQKGRNPTLRFWNAESRARGAGYVQLPVYFLSLSRFFPIGETGKTQKFPIELTPEELTYCVNNYRTILSIQDIFGTPSVGVEKAASSKIFAGVSDDTHDIFTNSAGESNITKIILAILSFKRLMEKYGREYKGGILLIDELDATLYGFSQTKLVDYLSESAEKYNIQIVFTTHSPIILQRVNWHQRREHKVKGINLPLFAYDNSIVYLEPKYNEEGKRVIVPQNIFSVSELNRIIDDMNLTVSSNKSKIGIYCEDTRATDFLRYVLTKVSNMNLDLYMEFINIDLGWTNYVQLVDKRVPEFRNNIIVLDGDVKDNPQYKQKERIIRDAGNILFLPLVIEKDIFELLKDHLAFSRFQATFCKVPAFTYDVCFNNWALPSSQYVTKDFKNWYHQTEDVLGEQHSLFDFWCEEHKDILQGFIAQFVNLFNSLADQNGVDPLPPFTFTPQSSVNTEIPAS